MVLKSLFLTGTLFLSFKAYSLQFDPRMAFNIASVEVEKVDTPLVENIFEMAPTRGGTFNKEGSEAAMVVGEVIAVGEKIWPIVEKGRPVVSAQFSNLSALPRFEDTLSFPELYEMAGWVSPGAATYKVSFKNYLGMEVVLFRYTVTFQPGGSYLGVGRYLTNVKVYANELKVAWGYNVEASTSLVGLTNKGSKEDPIASMVLQVNYNVKTVFSESHNSSSYYVAGDGTFKEL